MKKIFEAPCARIVYVEESDVIATSDVRMGDPMENGGSSDIQMFHLIYEEEEEEF